MSIPDWITVFETPHGDDRFAVSVANVLSSNDGDVAISMVIASVLEGLDDAYCLDIGAHLGWFSLFCVSQVPNARVDTFEPHPLNFEELQRNIRPYQQITGHPFAISDFEGALPFTFGCGETHSRDSSGTMIQCRRIDAFLTSNETIHIIKIDTEGHELRILKTFEPYLSKIDTIISEITIYWYGETEEDAVEKTYTALEPFFDVFPYIYSLSRRSVPTLYGPIEKINLKQLLSSWYKLRMSTDIVFSKNIKLVQTPLLSHFQDA